MASTANPVPAPTGFSSVEEIESYFDKQISDAESKITAYDNGGLDYLVNTVPTLPFGGSQSWVPRMARSMQIIRRWETHGFKRWLPDQRLESGTYAYQLLPKLERRNEARRSLPLKIQYLKTMRSRELQLFKAAQAGQPIRADYKIFGSYENINRYFSARIESVEIEKKEIEKVIEKRFRGKWGQTTTAHWIQLILDKKDLSDRMALEKLLGKAKGWKSEKGLYSAHDPPQSLQPSFHSADIPADGFSYVEEIEFYFDRLIFEAKQELETYIAEVLAFGVSFNPSGGDRQQRVGLLQRVENGYCKNDLGEAGKDRLAVVEQRDERMRVLGLKISDLTKMKEREIYRFNVAKGKVDGKSFYSYEDINEHYNPRLDKIRNDIEVGEHLGWGVDEKGRDTLSALMLEEKDLKAEMERETALGKAKGWDLKAEREREREREREKAFGEHKGWSCGKDDYNVDANDDILYG